MANNSPFVLLPVLGLFLKKTIPAILLLEKKLGSYIIQHG